jgi:hypothetical protein
MKSNFAYRVLVLSLLVLGAAALSCGSVSTVRDGGTAGNGSGGTAGTTGAGGTGTAGTNGMGGSGVGGGGDVDAGPITCRIGMTDCPANSTCACGGPGPGICTCHRNCTDTNQCPVAEPMCGCPSSTGATARYCVNQCFCTCQ